MEEIRVVEIKEDIRSHNNGQAGYTRSSTMSGATATLYSYDGDRLTAYGTETFAYDNVGNPTTYRGKSAVWTKGRQLKSYNGVSFIYDGNGRRRMKGLVSYTYDSDGRLVSQSNGLEFFYDVSGVAGLYYNGNLYYYRKDMQGNINAILDITGAVVVQYVYDAWGNYAVLDGNGNDITSPTNIGNLNPFRYRGYYYDTETGLYYLQTRYYDPELGRFITIDGIEYLDTEPVSGHNLYAYCGNNPIMYVDPSGHFFFACIIVGAVIGAIVGGVVKGVEAASEGASGWELVGQVVLGVACGAVIGGIAGAVVGAAAGGIGPMLGGGSLALAGGGALVSDLGIVAARGALTVGGAVVVGGVAVAIAGLNVLFSIEYHGKPNSTVTSGGSTGIYDENGNLTSRRDTTGRPHFIKELQDYYLPHTHNYEWKFIKGVWRIVREWILPF